MLTIADGTDGQQIDLGAKRVCTIEYDKERFKCEDFTVYRERMEKAQEAFAGLRGGDQPSQQPQGEAPPEMEVKIDINKPGKFATKNGVECELTDVTITILRDGKEKKLEVKLGTRAR